MSFIYDKHVKQQILDLALPSCIIHNWVIPFLFPKYLRVFYRLFTAQFNQGPLAFTICHPM